MTEPFSSFLSPLRIGPLQVKNRAVSTAHAAIFSWTDPRDTGDRQIAYIRRRAAGGVGLIIHEAFPTIPWASASGPYAYDYMRQRYGRLASAVHGHGAGIIQQIMFNGALARSDRDLEPLWSFSGMTTPEGETSHAMSAEEIQSTINGFAQSARLMVESGLDGVELHACHGTLLQQSYSPWGNQRNDAWGEPLRYIRAVIEKTREAIGKQSVLGLRICINDFVPKEQGGLDPTSLIHIAQTLVRDGQIDYINHSEGSHAAHYTRSVGSWRHPHGEFLPLTADLKAAVGAAFPVVGVGRIVTPEHAERLLRTGVCDLVGMTRAHIADPDVVVKVQSGQRDRIRQCVGANQGCIDRTLAGLPITCFMNPEVGQEYLLGELVPAAIRKHVLVVGGGPAGLKAAEVAARRGHRVTLVEQETHVGGRLRNATKLVSATELDLSIRWLERELEMLQVEVSTGTQVDVALVEKMSPDVIILATGAEPRPDLAFTDNSDSSIAVISPDDAMDLHSYDKDVLLLDGLGNHEAIFAAEHLALNKARVTIISPRPVIGAYIGATQLGEIQARLTSLGCQLQPNYSIARIEQGKVCLRSTLNGEEQARQFDIIVASVPAFSVVALQEELQDLGIAVLVAGDAKAPRTALHAFREGDAAGRAV
jgi:2,4-dienoyl-CoA reductase-like NADH-dependent reductase (Old Yellow Enzyme family)/thioredoxin reductase